MTENGKTSHESETKHPGWLPLSDLLDAADPLFEKVLFLPGYEFSSNVYVVEGTYLSIVDPGNDYSAFIDLFERGYRPSDVKKVVVTHGHRDHAMGVFDLLRSYPTILENGGFELILHEAAPPELKDMVRKSGCRVTEVRGGETLEISGLDWEVIHTPGHTPGSTCFLINDCLLSGDTLFVKACGRSDLPGGDPEQLHHSLGRIAALDERITVYPGHDYGDTPQSTIGAEKRENPFLRHTGGGRDGPEDFAGGLHDDFPRRARR